MCLDDPNIYDDADKFGLELFEEINDDHADYTFDDFVIWKRLTDGALLYGTDSGCSCPSPFEEQTAASLTKITSIEQLELAIEEYRKNYNEYKCTIERKQEVVNKVKEYLKEKKK